MTTDLPRSAGKFFSRFILRGFFHRRLSPAPLLLLAAVSITGCGGSLHLSGRWAAVPPPINGVRDQAWDPAMIKIPDRNMMVGILNDSGYLYLSLVTDDRGIQRQVLTGGMSIWFDPGGGTDKRFGLNYPISGMPAAGDRALREGLSRDGARGEENGEDGEFRRPPFDSTEVEIFGPFPGDHARKSIASLRDLALKIGFDGGTMVYQLRVPFRDRGANPYAIGAGPGSEIGVGLESGEKSSGRRPGGGGSVGDMSPGGGGDRGGHGGGMWAGGRPSAPRQGEPLEIWAKIRLAVR
jgi:hypothetical protein